MNTGIVLLTGDNQKTAEHFASQAGIRQVRAQLLPKEKVGSINKLQDALFEKAVQCYSQNH